jgi:hypothetical protein
MHAKLFSASFSLRQGVEVLCSCYPWYVHHINATYLGRGGRSHSAIVVISTVDARCLVPS